MGMFDEIRWQATLPAGHPEDSRLFQTKSLDPCLEHYVVTREGRLVLVGNGWRDDADVDGEQGIDVEFHGDMRLVSMEGQIEYLARFTHGTLEWIRPLVADEPWSKVAAARMKLSPAQSNPKGGQRIEQPEHSKGISEEKPDEHVTTPKAE